MSSVFGFKFSSTTGPQLSKMHCFPNCDLCFMYTYWISMIVYSDERFLEFRITLWTSQSILSETKVLMEKPHCEINAHESAVFSVKLAAFVRSFCQEIRCNVQFLILRGSNELQTKFTTTEWFHPIISKPNFGTTHLPR